MLSAESLDHVSLLSQGRKGADLSEGSENFSGQRSFNHIFLDIPLLSGTRRARVVRSKYFSVFKAQHELLCQNGKNIWKNLTFLRSRKQMTKCSSIFCSSMLLFKINSYSHVPDFLHLTWNPTFSRFRTFHPICQRIPIFQQFFGHENVTNRWMNCISRFLKKTFVNKNQIERN